MSTLSQKVNEQLGISLDDAELQTALDTVAQIATTKSLSIDSLVPELPSTLEAQLTEQHSSILNTLDSLLAQIQNVQQNAESLQQLLCHIYEEYNSASSY